MTRLELQRRIDEGAPFTLHVADGRSFEVPHGDFIHLPPSRSTVVFVTEYLDSNEDDEQDTYTHIVPLLMVSGVSRKTDRDSVSADT